MTAGGGVGKSGVNVLRVGSAAFMLFLLETRLVENTLSQKCTIKKGETRD